MLLARWTAAQPLLAMPQASHLVAPEGLGSRGGPGNLGSMGKAPLPTRAQLAAHGHTESNMHVKWS